MERNFSWLESEKLTCGLLSSSTSLVALKDEKTRDVTSPCLDLSYELSQSYRSGPLVSGDWCSPPSHSSVLTLPSSLAAHTHLARKNGVRKDSSESPGMSSTQASAAFDLIILLATQFAL